MWPRILSVRMWVVFSTLTLVGVNCSVSAFAYTFLPPECGDDIRACLKDKKLDYVSIYGPIRDQDEEFFDELDGLLPRGKPFPIVYVNSPGGHMRVAISIGRILRDRKAEVRSGSPIFPDEKPECSSACGYIAAGAVRRYLSHLGIHSGYIRESTGCGEWEPSEMDAKGRRMSSDYLREMGISKAFDVVRDRTPSETISDYYLDRKKPLGSQELIELGFFQGSEKDFSKLPPVAFDERDSMANYYTYLQNAAKQGLAPAIWELIEYINSKSKGSEASAKLAFKWLKELVARNDGYAHYVIGNYYADGYGVEKDEKEALRYYMLAAEQGVGQAQAILGEAYFKGAGVIQDDVQALTWSTRAAERGEPLAYATLCQIYGQLATSPVGKAQGAKWCKLAVSKTNSSKLVRSLESVQTYLSKGMSAKELQQVQDGALNWKPLRKKRDDFCYAGAERY